MDKNEKNSKMNLMTQKRLVNTKKTQGPQRQKNGIVPNSQINQTHPLQASALNPRLSF